MAKSIILSLDLESSSISKSDLLLIQATLNTEIEISPWFNFKKYLGEPPLVELVKQIERDSSLPVFELKTGEKLFTVENNQTEATFYLAEKIKSLSNDDSNMCIYKIDNELILDLNTGTLSYKKLAASLIVKEQTNEFNLSEMDLLELESASTGTDESESLLSDEDNDVASSNDHMPQTSGDNESFYSDQSTTEGDDCSENDSDSENYSEYSNTDIESLNKGSPELLLAKSLQELAVWFLMTHQPSTSSLKPDEESASQNLSFPIQIETNYEDKTSSSLGTFQELHYAAEEVATLTITTRIFMPLLW